MSLLARLRLRRQRGRPEPTPSGPRIPVPTFQLSAPEADVTVRLHTGRLSADLRLSAVPRFVFSTVEQESSDE